MRGDAGGPDAATVSAELTALRRTARALTGRQDDADDLVPAVFERVLPRWHRIAGDPHGYLLKVLINLHRDRARRATRFGRIPEPPDRPAPDEPGEVADRIDLDRLLATLPVRTRQIVVLRYLDDLSAPEVARLVGLSAGGVRRIASQALATLRPHLTDPVQEAR